MQTFENSLLSSIADKEIAVLHKKATMHEAIEQITGNNGTIGIFLEDGYPVGLITERDIIKNIITGKGSEYPAYDYATKNVISVRENRSIEYAIFLMSENNIKRLVVCDTEGKFTGVLSQDIITTHLNTYLNKNKLRAINMVRGQSIITMDENSTLYAIASCFYSNKIGIMPLMREGCICGVVTETDILNLSKSGVDFAQNASHFMSSPPIVVNEFASLEEILNIFEHYRIKHVIVASNNCAPLGVISKRDIIRNMNENYYKMLERKARNFKVTINTLSAPALELFNDGNEFIVEWYNQAAIDIFDKDIFDKSLYEVVGRDTEAEIKTALKNNDLKKEILYVLNDEVYDIKPSLLSDNTVSLIFNNITKYHNAKKFIHSLFDLLTEIIIVSDGKNISFSNVSMLKFFNVDSLEVFKQHSSCICDYFIKEEGYLHGDKEGRWIEESLKSTEEGRDCKVKMKNAQGQERIFQVVTKGFPEMHHSYVSSFFDITEAELYKTMIHHQNQSLEDIVEKRTKELKVSKTLLEKAQTISRLGSCIYDIDSQQLECFGNLQGILGVEKAPDSINTFIEVLEERGRLEFKKAINRLIESKSDSSLQVNLDPAFSKKTIFIKAEPYEMKNGVVSKVFGTIQDITEQAELSRKANYDSLTSIYNRHKIEDIKLNDLEAIRQASKNVSLIIFDIDRFKNINDRFGHDQGDCILKELSEIVKTSIRESDIFARWGGEEFLLILPNSDLKSASITAEKLRQVIELSVMCGIEDVTCSFGVSLLAKGEDFEASFKRADSALYEAKNSGRNRVAVEK